MQHWPPNGPSSFATTFFAFYCVIKAIAKSSLGTKGLISSYRLESIKEGSQAKNPEQGP